MSLRLQSLGCVASAAAGILITTATNATPIVATVTNTGPYGHGLKNGDRIVISGVTGLTAMNGEWTIANVAATTIELVGSAGNGAFGGTAAVAVVCDKTPFMKGHSAVIAINSSPVGVATAAVGTVLVESSDDNSTFADAKVGIALAAQTADQTQLIEVVLKKYMRFRASAYTSGAFSAQIIA